MLKPVVVALGLSSPFLLHLALLSDRPALAATLTVSLTLLVLWRRAAPALRWMLLVPMIAACAAAAFLPTAALWTVYAAPVLIYGGVGALFGRTLMAGRKPLVARIARLDRGGTLPDDLARYARGVTWAWTLLMALLATLSVSLAVYGTPQTWSWFNNVLALMLIAGLFLGEYAYRLLRFRHYPHNSPLHVARLMVRNAPQLLR